MPSPHLPDRCFSVLATSPLFAGIAADDLPQALELLHARCHTFGRGELVQRLGEPFKHVGVVISGEVEGTFDNERFDPVNMNRFSAGAMYGAAFACAGTKASPIQLEALKDSEIVLLEVVPLMDPPATGRERALGADPAYDMDPALKAALLRNLLAVVAHQSTFLARKVRILGQKGLRDRIVVFLRGLPVEEGGWRELPFSQTTMAQFIGANRSAVSRELGRMMDDGLVRMDGRRIMLLG